MFVEESSTEVRGRLGGEERDLGLRGEASVENEDLVV
jgi:hypothetical protein